MIIFSMQTKWRNLPTFMGKATKRRMFAVLPGNDALPSLPGYFSGGERAIFNINLFPSHHRHIFNTTALEEPLPTATMR